MSFSLFASSGVLNPVNAQIPPQKIEVSPTSQPPSQPLFIQELKLTPEQVKKIDIIRQQGRKEVSQIKNELDQSEQELENLLNSSNASEIQLRDKFSQVEQLRQNLSKSTFENILATRAVLTPEQRTAFEPVIQRLRESRRK